MRNTADAFIDENRIARFRCPECARGLRVPEEVIGRKIGCPFCQTLYKTSFALVVEANSAKAESNRSDLPKNQTVSCNEVSPTQSLTRFVPSKANMKSAMGIVAKTVKSGTDLGIQTTQNAAAAVSSTAHNAAAAVSSTAKKAAAAATPLTQVVTGFASVVLPGAGEVMAGKTTQGFCTMAAFIGAAGVATGGGAWIAAPIAIGIFSAMRGVQAGRELGKKIKDGIETSDVDELQSIAEEMKNCAASMTDEQFQQLLIETEEAELLKVQERPQKKIVLTKIRKSPPIVD